MARHGIYYAGVDTVKFDTRTAESEDLGFSSANATAVILANLLIAGGTPVLSQNQVFDNRYLLDLVANFGSDESKAIRKLVEESVIRTKIFEKGLRDAPTEQRFTVANAFASQLENRQYYLSAWPELVDSDARTTVAKVVLGETSEQLSGALARRVEAVKALSNAFIASKAVEASKVLSDLSLEALVRNDLDSQSSPRALVDMWQTFRTFLDPTPTRYNLEFRSQWRAAIADFVEKRGLPPGHPMLDRISRFVDFHYHRVMGASLEAASVADDEGPDTAHWLKASLANPQLIENALFLTRSDIGGEVLSWRQAAALWSELRNLSPSMRLERLVEKRVVELAHGTFAVRVVAPAPKILLGAAVSAPVATFAGVGMDTVLPESTIWNVGAALTAVITEAAGAISAPALLPPTSRAVQLTERWSEWVTTRAEGKVRKKYTITSRTPESP